LFLFNEVAFNIFFQGGLFIQALRQVVIISLI